MSQEVSVWYGEMMQTIQLDCICMMEEREELIQNASSYEVASQPISSIKVPVMVITGGDVERSWKL